MPSDKNFLGTGRRLFLGRLMRTAGAAVSAVSLHWAALRAQDRVLATVKIADSPNLKKVGGFVLIEGTPAGELLVIRTSESEFISLSNVCPHKHCSVRVINPTLIRCPCHRSTYKIDGTYVSGPSKASLKKFVTRVEGDTITALEN
jgi:Rieske Fe-S protein